MYNTEARGYTSKKVLHELEHREFDVGRKVGLIWMRS